jgi:hypothetical protein
MEWCSMIQENFVFDGRTVIPATSTQIFGVDGPAADDFGAMGFYQLETSPSPHDPLCVLWQMQEDVYLVEMTLNDAGIRYIRIEGYPLLLEFIRLHLHPLVALQFFGRARDFSSRDFIRPKASQSAPLRATA